MKTITLRSNDGFLFDIKVEIARLSKTIEAQLKSLGIIDELGNDTAGFDYEKIILTLSMISGVVLTQIVSWCNYHHDDPKVVDEIFNNDNNNTKQAAKEEIVDNYDDSKSVDDDVVNGNANRVVKEEVLDNEMARKENRYQIKLASRSSERLRKSVASTMTGEKLLMVPIMNEKTPSAATSKSKTIVVVGINPRQQLNKISDTIGTSCGDEIVNVNRKQRQQLKRKLPTTMTTDPTSVGGEYEAFVKNIVHRREICCDWDYQLIKDADVNFLCELGRAAAYLEIVGLIELIMMAVQQKLIAQYDLRSLYEANKMMSFKSTSTAAVPHHHLMWREFQDDDTLHGFKNYELHDFVDYR